MDIGDQETELLSQSFSDSLKDETAECLSNIIEVGLDSILDDGIVKDIPFISTAVSLYRIGNSIRDRHNLKKLAVFLQEINSGCQSEEKRQEYAEKFCEEQKFRNNELEYVLVLIDRYIGYNKPKMIAKLYLAYLNCAVSWDEFCAYAEIIDRFLPGDAELLCAGYPERIQYLHTRTDDYERLISLGLMRKRFHKATLDDIDNVNFRVSGYETTSSGEKLCSILK